MLPDELDAKLSLGPEPGRGSAPPSAPPSISAGSPPAGAAGTQGAQQQPGDIASLWGNAQVRRPAAPGSPAAACCAAGHEPSATAAHACLRHIPVPPCLLTLPSPPPCLQGDRNDPFGSYLAGLRLGTGF